jgi:hypothetical protein
LAGHRLVFEKSISRPFISGFPTVYFWEMSENLVALCYLSTAQLYAKAIQFTFSKLDKMTTFPSSSLRYGRRAKPLVVPVRSLTLSEVPFSLDIDIVFLDRRCDGHRTFSSRVHETQHLLFVRTSTRPVRCHKLRSAGLNAAWNLRSFREVNGDRDKSSSNAGALSLLAKEFLLEDLLSDCSALQKASVPELRKPELISGASHLMNGCEISNLPIRFSALVSLG